MARPMERRLSRSTASLTHSTPSMPSVAEAPNRTVRLVLPVSLLLFLQWPLRDLVQAYSIESNDLAESTASISSRAARFLSCSRR